MSDSTGLPLLSSIERKMFEDELRRKNAVGYVTKPVITWTKASPEQFGDRILSGIYSGNHK